MIHLWGVHVGFVVLSVESEGLLLRNVLLRNVFVFVKPPRQTGIVYIMLPVFRVEHLSKDYAHLTHVRYGGKSVFANGMGR